MRHSQLYFSPKAARAKAQELREDGLEVEVIAGAGTVEVVASFGSHKSERAKASMAEFIGKPRLKPARPKRPYRGTVEVVAPTPPWK